MKKLRIFIHALLLATTPTLFAYPLETLPKIVVQNEQQKIHPSAFSYDEVLALLNELESGEAENKYNSEDLERINQFVSLLAEEGMIMDDITLHQDVAFLLNEEGPSWSYAYFFGDAEFVLCGGFISSKWHQTKKFVKKHKKTILIGAVVVVGAAAIVYAVIAASTVATGAAAATTAGAAKAGSHPSSKLQEPKEKLEPLAAMENAPNLQYAISEQVASFKEIAQQGQLFDLAQSSNQNNLSMEENGRILGSIFAHEGLRNIQQQQLYQPHLAQEVEQIHSKYAFPISSGHAMVDQKFSTDFINYQTGSSNSDFQTRIYQTRGATASDHGYYHQAISDLGKAIELEPHASLPYLERGVAHFYLGQYDKSLQDYHDFAAKVEQPLSIPEFSWGFAKGVPRGVYDSGSGLLLLISDVIQHPVHTGAQMYESLCLLNDLVRSEGCAVVGEVLAPEIHQLVKEWDTLSSERRGELAGYAFGKYGSDIMIPGALAKVVARGMKGAQQISRIYQGLQTAERTLLLESVATLESGAAIGEMVSGRVSSLATDLGFTAREIAQLENITHLESSLNGLIENSSQPFQNMNFSKHALQRAIERGVPREAIFDALQDPLKIDIIKIDNFGRPSQRFIGKKAEVAINPDTQQIVSVNPTSTKKIERLQKELCNVED